MPTFIPTPTNELWPKLQKGISDTSIGSGTYQFMGCNLLSCSCTLGFNGTASSLNVTLAEDVALGQSFSDPTIPSLWAFSLPSGGNGVPILYPSNPPSLQPNDWFNSNVPMYFAGICTSYRETKLDVSGKTIQVTLVDPREILTGVQCLLNGFALSQNVGTGSPRYTAVDNVIDVFGYFNYGWESDANEYGMQWNKIEDALENVRVTIQGINFEFLFTGETFANVPHWYRINEPVMDLMSLVQRVANDSGSDVVAIARKVSSADCIVEFRGIKRTNTDALTQSELQNFVTQRSGIVENFTLGKEYRNEPTSSIIVGGMRNKNYVALPSSYSSSIHLRADTGSPSTLGSGVEDYNSFPNDIKVRLFGGSYTKYTDDDQGNPVSTTTENLDVDSGAIFPFWGFTPDDHAYPLIEPFLPLDHLVFDKDSSNYGNLKQRIPACKISVGDFTVRNVPHSGMFLPDDELPDDRPFAYLESYTFSSATTLPSGYIRGLPLNTEVLRAALSERSVFFSIYSLHYPDVAESLDMSQPNFAMLQNSVNIAVSGGRNPNLENAYTQALIMGPRSVGSGMQAISVGRDGKMNQSTVLALQPNIGTARILEKFNNIIYEHVRQYAIDYMGRKFLACLPRSEIMNRIWDQLPVPTNINKPQIEYVVDQRGYWEYEPFELDGIIPTGSGYSTFTGDEEDQIRRKFMAEDGRFSAMVAIDWKPTGNVSFNANGINKAMFQDFPESEFRPNKLASGNPEFIFVSCSVNQLVKRPDLALVELPSSIEFDPPEYRDFPMHTYRLGVYDTFLATRSHIIKYLWYFIKRDNAMRAMFKLAATQAGENFADYTSRIISVWAENIRHNCPYGIALGHDHEIVMDLKGIVIPLTSTWVSYGPWYATNVEATGMVDIKVDESLVPWNFERPVGQNWDANLNAAGEDRLEQTLAVLDWVDNASIVAAGFPEFGLATFFGYNSNLTGLSVDFSIGGVKTTYNFSTFAARPGTYRKADYDDVSRARIDTREQLPVTENINVVADIMPSNVGRNRFEY